MMTRRTFASALVAGATVILMPCLVRAEHGPAARNIVLVHGLFADGSCWSEVIARLQAAGLHVTSVQNPLTALDDAVAATQRVLARQDGPTVLVGHSFAGMIVTEAGVDPRVSAVVYVAARAPDAEEDYTELATKFPAPPASAGIVYDDDEGRLTEAAFLRDFAGDLPEARARVLYAVQQPFHRALLTGKTTQDAWRSKPSFYAVATQDRTINPDLASLYGQTHGSNDHRGERQPFVAYLTPPGDHRSDPASRASMSASTTQRGACGRRRSASHRRRIGGGRGHHRIDEGRARFQLKMADQASAKCSITKVRAD